jgi:serpin B
MNRFFLLAEIVLLFLGTNSKAEHNKSISDAKQKARNEKAAVVKANNAFAFDLYARLRQNQKGNLFFSPYSISTALGMMNAGARGETAQQIAKTLHFSLEPTRLHPTLKSLINELNGTSSKRSYELHVANSLWGQKGYPFFPSFLKQTAENYQADVNTVDFRETEKARQTINRWVEKNTRQKIKGMFGPNTLDAETRLVLANAIYFKAQWWDWFEKEDTKKEVFRLAPNKKVANIPMMHQKQDCRHYDGGSFQVLELPYKNNDLQMVLLLPKKVGGLAKFEQQLTASRLDEWLYRAKAYQVDITMPKFHFTSEFSLKKILSMMGMPLAFSTRADFSGIGKSEELRLGAVMHTAYINLHELGTEVAVASVGNTIGSLAPAKRKVTFRADHPFVFLIRHTQTGTILFMGRLTNPQSDG